MRVIGFACESFPTVTHVFADSGYAGEKLEAALAKMNGPVIEIVKRPDGAKGFVLVARRWVVNEHSPGSIAAEGSPRIGKPLSPHPKHGCSSPPSGSSPDASLEQHNQDVNFESNS